MSQTATVTITCPKCGKNHPFEIWDSVNTTLDPDMKEKVASGEIFRFTCPSCGAETQVNYNLLYHQMDDRIMIQFARMKELQKSTKRSSAALQRLWRGCLRNTGTV
ncbi:MAG: CpXC domain-containing protein, partial [Solobacterium sp.]|nr:CpXC domain-containing protein [Solobacterium sp.]